MTPAPDRDQEGLAEAARTRDRARTRAEILDAAVAEFSARGLLGARVDGVVERTATTKRMVYYYFASKEELYRAALTESYRRIRVTEEDLHLEEVEPEAALRLLVRATLAHQGANPDFVRLVMFENTLGGEAIRLMSADVHELNRSAVAILGDVLARGRASGVFRADGDAPDALDVHQVISALSFFRVANRETFRALFDRDMVAGEDGEHVCRLVEDTVLRLVRAVPG